MHDQSIHLTIPNRHLQVSECIRNYKDDQGSVHVAWAVGDNQVVVFDNTGSLNQPGLSVYQSRAEYFASIKEQPFIRVAEAFVHEPPAQTMYNSHGEWSTVGEIFDIEVERGNDTFDGIDLSWVEQNRNAPAIWGTVKPVDALRYAISADEWGNADEVLEARYPDYKNEMICEIDTAGLVQIGDDDGDGGYLLVQITEK